MSKDIKNATPKGVVFGTTKIECLLLAKKYNKKVVLVSRDIDYLSLGKTVKDELENNQIEVSTIVLDDDFSADVYTYRKMFIGLENTLIIAVGGESICNLARFFAKINDTNVVVVPTEIAFSSMLCEKAELLYRAKLGLKDCRVPDSIIIDLVFMSGLKKQSFADAYCQIASKLIALIDYQCDLILAKKSGSKSLNSVLYVISQFANAINDGANSHIEIINAQLKLALIARGNADWFFGNESKLAHLLGCIKEGSAFENAFFASLLIIRLYEAFLSCDMLKCFVSPDYNARILELNELSGASELSIISGYKPLDFDELVNCRDALRSSDLILLVKKCSQILQKLENGYSYVYKGRQKRANFNLKELKRVIRLAGYLGGGGLLKLISDSGVCECLD